MDDDNNNFFAIPADDGAPPTGGEAPPVDGSTDFFGAPPATGDNGLAAFIGDVNETDDAFAAAPDAFEAPPSGDGEAPIILGAPSPETEAPGMDGADVDQPQAAPVLPAGPSPMQKWNEDWQETLLKRKDDENAKKAEMLEAARVALENFQKEREMKREAKMAKNREDEQAKLEAIEADLENDNSWQRVCKMVELSHDSTDKAEDVKRMRDALIYLKNDPTRAEVLGS